MLRNEDTNVISIKSGSGMRITHILGSKRTRVERTVKMNPVELSMKILTDCLMGVRGDLAAPGERSLTDC